MNFPLFSQPQRNSPFLIQNASNAFNFLPMVPQYQLGLGMKAMQLGYLERVLQAQKTQYQQQLQTLLIQQQSNKNLSFLSMSKGQNEPKLNVPFLQETPLKPFKTEKLVKEEDTDSTTVGSDIQKDDFSGIQLKTQIKQLISWFLLNFGKVDQAEMNKRKMICSVNPVLSHIFDILSTKYASSAKCREDMIRFVLRKALSYLRNNLRSSNKLSAKAASLLMCRKYFDGKTEEMVKNNISLNDDKEVLNFLLPYKKNSRNKTANSSFISEIFASSAFHCDYMDYLNNFDEILETDNESKLDKFVSYIMKCVQEGTIEKVKNFKRVPWLKCWLETSKIIAKELLNANDWKSYNKRTIEKKIKI